MTKPLHLNKEAMLLKPIPEHMFRVISRARPTHVTVTDENTRPTQAVTEASQYIVALLGWIELKRTALDNYVKRSGAETWVE